jgi:hypothetical protein
METDLVFETMCSIEYQKTNKVQKLSTPPSKHLSIYLADWIRDIHEVLVNIVLNSSINFLPFILHFRVHYNQPLHDTLTR